MLDLYEERMAVHYSLLFLKTEIDAITESISVCNDNTVKPILEKRLNELNKDFKKFQNVNNKL